MTAPKHRIAEEHRGSQRGPDSYRNFCGGCGLPLLVALVWSRKRNLLCGDCARAHAAPRFGKCAVCWHHIPTHRPQLCEFCERDPDTAGKPIVAICLECHEAISHHTKRVHITPIMQVSGGVPLMRDDEDGYGGHGPAVRALEDANDDRA